MTDFNLLHVHDNLSNEYLLLKQKRNELTNELQKIDSLLSDISRISLNGYLGELEGKYISITQNWYENNCKYRIILGKCYEIETKNDTIFLSITNPVVVTYDANENIKSLCCDRMLKVYRFEIVDFPFISIRELSKKDYDNLSKQAIEKYL